MRVVCITEFFRTGPKYLSFTVITQHIGWYTVRQENARSGNNYQSQHRSIRSFKIIYLFSKKRGHNQLSPFPSQAYFKMIASVLPYLT